MSTDIADIRYKMTLDPILKGCQNREFLSFRLLICKVLLLKFSNLKNYVSYL